MHEGEHFLYKKKEQKKIIHGAVVNYKVNHCDLAIMYRPKAGAIIAVLLLHHNHYIIFLSGGRRSAAGGQKVS